MVNIGMLLFRADSLPVFAGMFVSMFRKTTGHWLELGLDVHDLAVLAAGVGASVPVAAIGSLSAGAAGAQPARKVSVSGNGSHPCRSYGGG